MRKKGGIPANRQQGIFYGWIVLIASFIMLFFNAGAQFSIGVMFKPIIVDFGWNRGSISMIVLINMMVYALSMLVMGRAYDRFGPRWVILISATFLGSGFLGLSWMSGFGEFVLYYGILCGIGFSGCTILIFSSLISKWFEKWRGLVISSVLSGSCLGQFFLIPFYNNLIIEKGWQSTCFLIGALTFCINFLLAMTIVKGDPDQLGIQPLGRVIANSQLQPPVSKGDIEHTGDFTVSEAIKTSLFWLYVGVMFVCGAGDFLISTHLVPLITDFGIDQKTAGEMLAWFGLFGLMGILIAGPLSDMIGNKIPILGTFVIRVGLLVMILTLQNKITFYLFSFGFGFTMLITGVLTVTLIGKIFGYSNIGTLTGLITTIHHLGGGILVYTGGVVYDQAASYRSILIVYIVMALMAIVACLFIKEKRLEMTHG